MWIHLVNAFFCCFLLIFHFAFSLSPFPFFGRFNEIKMKCWIFVCRIRNYLNHCCFTENCCYLSVAIVHVFVLFFTIEWGQTDENNRNSHYCLSFTAKCWNMVFLFVVGLWQWIFHLILWYYLSRFPQIDGH